MGRIERRQFLAAAGALLAMPHSRAPRAQEVRRVGFLQQNSPKRMVARLSAELSKYGWRDGENLRFVSATGDNDPARWDAIAQDLVQQHPDLIVAMGSHMALRVKRATHTIPVVMMTSGYPVEAGLVKSLAQPGGNITGLKTLPDGIWGKFPELLRDAVPSMRRLGIFGDYVPPAFVKEETDVGFRDLRRAAHALDVQVQEWLVQNDADLAQAIAQARDASLDALIVTSGPTNTQPRNRSRIKELVLDRRLPMMSDLAGSVFREASGLMAYAVSFTEVAARTAWYVHRILTGAKPADLPIEQPTRLPLVVNLQTAKAIGLTIPRSILLRADRVIE